MFIARLRTYPELVAQDSFSKSCGPSISLKDLEKPQLRTAEVALQSFQPGWITQITSSLNDSTHPGTLATISYTPFGAINTLLNGCAGSGCVQRQETYDYNNRLQPVRIQLGTPSDNDANYCLVYNYYGGSNPTSCAVPSPGGGNNGNVTGYLYLDSTNGSLQHQVVYSYDTVNRLTSSIASPVSPGTVSHHLDFSYDRYGNMKCVTDGQRNGPCPNWTFNPASNRITTSGFQYDAAGNLTSDGSCNYQWDAEGRPKSVSGCRTATFTYNVPGQLVQTNDARYKEEFAYGAFGENLGDFDGVGSVWWSKRVPFPGRRLLASNVTWAGTATIFAHPNVLGSETAFTNYSGTTLNERHYYPWGQWWTQVGQTMDNSFAQMPGEQELNYTPNRRYQSTQGCWLSPDPAGLKAVTLTDPQTWNMYAYVRNNPTTLTDPSGLIVQCSSSLNKKDAALCQGIIGAANMKDRNGKYVYQNLHNVYDRLESDKRTFTITNTKLEGQTAGRFDVRGMNSSRTDFASGTINLDFSKIKGMTGPSPSMITRFKEYQGLIGKFNLELAEGFGHEGEHGVYALDHRVDAVKTQSLINDEFESLQMRDMGQFLRDGALAQPYLHATELDAQEMEQKVNRELNADPQE